MCFLHRTVTSRGTKVEEKKEGSEGKERREGEMCKGNKMMGAGMRVVCELGVVRVCSI